jgi:hypothetical protein
MGDVYILIKGRLGNQYFQYWFGKYISEKLNRNLIMHFNEPIIYIDRNIYKNIPDFNIIPRIEVWNNDHENGFYSYTSTSSVDIDQIIATHQNKTLPIFINLYVEDYSNIRKHEEYVKMLFERSIPLICNESIVIHLRLGDVADNNANVNDDYCNFALSICKKYNWLPVIIVSEEVNHSCTNQLKDRILDAGNKEISIVNNGYQSDFESVQSAKVIICSNSTFTWWASFLNPFKPDIYVALSDRQAASFRNRDLYYKDSPDSWNIWNLDCKRWHNLNISATTTKKWVIVLFSDEGYIDKALNTIREVRQNGLWKDDIVLLIPKSLLNNGNVQNVARDHNIILRELPDNNTQCIIDEWNKHRNHENFSYINSRQYMYMKFHVFDTYFKQWDIIFYMDAGMKIHHTLERMKISCEPNNCIYAHSDAYPQYIWKLYTMFNIELFNDVEKSNISKFDLNVDYFQGTMFIYDTKIIDSNTVNDLFELAFKYKLSRRMDQGILNLYFTSERNLWKQIPIKDDYGFLYDYLIRSPYSRHDYLMLKS